MNLHPHLLRRALRAVLITACALATLPAVADEPGWVTRSNEHTMLVVRAQAQFQPERASSLGLAEYDGLAFDLGPRLVQRTVAAARRLDARLAERLAATTDADVRQDLLILRAAVNDEIANRQLEERLLLQWFDVPQAMYGGLRELLDDTTAPERRARAVERLRRYVGLHPGSTAVTVLARRAFDASLRPGRLGPVKAAVEDAIAQGGTYAQGVRELFARHGLDGPPARAALAAFEAQVAAHADWQRRVVLPRAREDFRLPPALYARQLRQMGIDVTPDELVAQARVNYLETRAAMQVLAGQLAPGLGLPAGSGYPEVIRHLKRDALPDDRLEAHYAEVNRQLEALVRRERLVSLPARPMVMRLASAAESAAQPAPHFDIPPLIGNRGEPGAFVLPTAPSGGSVEAGAYDDFNFPAAAWALSAHEARPGHELQFSAMLERGVSLARSLYAFNSVNVEGWALYAEAQMLPHLPPEGQMIALQFRLLRAARAMLDPLLNLGRIGVDDAARLLRDEVVLSPAMVNQEIERYTFRNPGQAGTYLHGYLRLLQLRAETELALGERFEPLAFHDFLLGQGLLPPAQLARAVREDFIPARRAAR